MQAQSQYDFITNPDKPHKKPALAGSSQQARIFVVLGGVVALLIIGAVVMSLISSASKSGQETILKAAQQQAELIRISKIGMTKARDPATISLATTITYSLESDQKNLLKYVKINAKDLALGKNAQTDVVLTTADQSNQFDQVFAQTAKSQLVAYQQTLKTAYDNTSGKNTKAALADDYKHASILLGKQ